MVQPEPLERLEFESADLAADSPPVLRDRNKRVIYSICCPEGCVYKGRIHYSRWPALPLPERVDVTGALERVVAREDLYDYKPAWQEGKSLERHVNFADPHLFTAYGTSLFTQDEMQVAEHPILGSLGEAILSQGLPALTVEDGSPTPVLVAGAERRCRRGGPQRFLGVRGLRRKPGAHGPVADPSCRYVGAGYAGFPYPQACGDGNIQQGRAKDRPGQKGRNRFGPVAPVHRGFGVQVGPK
jgi:hypothetical protein